MELLYIVLFGAIIYLLISNRNSLNEKIVNLELRVLEMQRLLKQSIDNRPKPETPKAESESRFVVPRVIPEVKKPDAVPLPPAPKPVIPGYNQWEKKIKEELSTPQRKPEPLPVPKKIINPPKPELSFLERYPDLEKFIGENLINKIGIAILVLAIAYFVKYAIDNNWVGPAGRVGIGILCGGILVGIAHRMRNSYKAFSSVLVGGGLAIFYFTITLAFHQFHLFNQTTSFIILIVITCFAVVLSLLYDKQELAVIALIGGLASPFMVSNGSNNYHALFIYMIILNAGLLIIAYNKSWRVLNIVSFGLTVLVVLAVMTSLNATSYATALLYISLLYLMFFAINVANNVRENKAFVTSDFTILLTNTTLYFSAGLYLLTMMHHEDLRGVFSACLAAANLVLSFVLFRTKRADSNILYLLIGITLTFISLTAPIQLHGHYITIFWAAESVLLYWLYLKSNIKLMKLTSLIVWGAMLISILMDWSALYGYSGNALAIIVNKGFITSLVSAISSYLLYVLINRDESPNVYGVGLHPKFFQVAALLFLFLSGLLEINHQFANRYPATSLNILYLMLYVPAFVYVFYMISKKVAAITLNVTVNMILLALTILIYLLALPTLFDLQYEILVDHQAPDVHFMVHWLGALFIGLLFYQLIMLVKNSTHCEVEKFGSWIVSGAIVTFLSLELCMASNLIFYKPATTIAHIQTVYIKTALPVLWGLSSFALMWLGMRNKARALRIISLTLFSITLLKLFLFDIRNIPPAGKIAAFFCLGVLLLIISFMYQKVKKIIVEDEVKEKD
jgi:uncharacterized membrane protein